MDADFYSFIKDLGFPAALSLTLLWILFAPRSEKRPDGGYITDLIFSHKGNVSRTGDAIVKMADAMEKSAETAEKSAETQAKQQQSHEEVLQVVKLLATTLQSLDTRVIRSTSTQASVLLSIAELIGEIAKAQKIDPTEIMAEIRRLLKWMTE